MTKRILRRQRQLDVVRAGALGLAHHPAARGRDERAQPSAASAAARSTVPRSTPPVTRPAAPEARAGGRRSASADAVIVSASFMCDERSAKSRCSLRKPPSILTREDGATIAYRRSAGKAPGVVFLGGFMSDMSGTKATRLHEFCAARGQAFVRFDYFAHGALVGRFHGRHGRALEGRHARRHRSAHRGAAWCWSDRASAAGSCAWRRWRGPQRIAALVGIAVGARRDRGADVAALPPVGARRDPARGRGARAVGLCEPRAISSRAPSSRTGGRSILPAGIRASPVPCGCCTAWRTRTCRFARASTSRRRSRRGMCR